MQGLYPLLLLLLLSMVALTYHMVRIQFKEAVDFSMDWDLFLSWIPLIVAFIVDITVKRFQRWYVWVGLWSVVWILFFPNAPYMITDLVHLSVDMGSDLTWHDMIMLFFYAEVSLFNGLVSCRRTFVEPAAPSHRSTDKPLIGDYDGDGKIDLGVWRPSTGTFYIQQSSSSILLTVVLGSNGDRPVSADFDGNGISDMAVYRPSNGTWYFRDPVTGVSSSFPWGNPEDTPIPADYDGDGKSDFAVFRPSTNQWLRINSTNGNAIDRTFGQAGGVPSPASIQPQ